MAKAPDTKSRAFVLGYSSWLSTLSRHSSSRVTPRAFASLMAFDTRQSSRRRMSSTVRLGSPAKSASCWTVSPFWVRICFRFNQIPPFNSNPIRVTRNAAEPINLRLSKISLVNSLFMLDKLKCLYYNYGRGLRAYAPNSYRRS